MLFDSALRQVLNLQRPFGAPLPTAPPDIPEVKNALELKQPLVSNLFAGRVGEMQRIAVTHPVIVNGQVKYVLGASVSLTALSTLLAGQNLPAGWIATIIDRNKTIIARTQNLDEFLGQTATPLLAAKSSEASSFRAVQVICAQVN